MQDLVLGLLAVLAGLFFCFRGRLTLRLIIPVWGAFAGFALGAGLVAGFAGERFLGTVLGWIVGLLFAVAFALLAYLYYFAGVVIAMGSSGFALGSALVVALGINWSWLVVTVGILVGVLFGVLAVVADLPMLLLVLVSALGGATVAVAGLMLLVGTLDTADFGDATITSQIQDDWWWYLLFLVLATAGVVTQSRDAATRLGAHHHWS